MINKLMLFSIIGTIVSFVIPLIYWFMQNSAIEKSTVLFTDDQKNEAKKSVTAGAGVAVLVGLLHVFLGAMLLSGMLDSLFSKVGFTSETDMDTYLTDVLNFDY